MDGSENPLPELPDNANILPLTERIKGWYRGLPDKKRYFEFITAFLSIPVLLTVLLTNFSNLRGQQSRNPETPTPSITYIIQNGTENITPNPTPTQAPQQSVTPSPDVTQPAQCTPGVGPVDISYPEEGSTVNSDPVCLDIPRAGGNYCSVVWSYRINGGVWSDYTDREICMYGLPPGNKQLELRVKSIVNGEEKVIKRNFTVAGSLPSPTPATLSAQLRSNI